MATIGLWKKIKRRKVIKKKVSFKKREEKYCNCDLKISLLSVKELQPLKRVHGGPRVTSIQVAVIKPQVIRKEELL